MAIIVILASIGMATYSSSITRAKEATLKEDLFRLRDAIDQYYADKNRYPPTLESLAEERYIRQVPVDPFTNSADTWQLTMSDPEPGNPAAEPGVYNVKSGSDQTGIDGTRYSDW